MTVNDKLIMTDTRNPTVFHRIYTNSHIISNRMAPYLQNVGGEELRITGLGGMPVVQQEAPSGFRSPSTPPLPNGETRLHTTQSEAAGFNERCIHELGGKKLNVEILLSYCSS